MRLPFFLLLAGALLAGLARAAAPATLAPSNQPKEPVWQARLQAFDEATYADQVEIGRAHV